MLLIFSSAQSQLILSQSFEGPFPPTGWTLINAGTSPNQWQQYSGTVLTINGLGSPQDGSYIAAVVADPSNAADAWLITSGLSLAAGTNYRLTFYYRVAQSSKPEKMKVTVGNDATVAAQTTVLWDNNGGSQLTNTTWALATINYTPAVGGNYYFGFNCYSDANEYLMMLDNVRFEAWTTTLPSCTTNLWPLNGATNVKTDSILLRWNAVPNATGYDIKFGLSSPPTGNAGNTTDTFIVFTDPPSTTFYWYIQPKNSAGLATGCEATVFSFTTEPSPANDTICNAAELFLNGPTLCGSTYNATVGTEDTAAAITCFTPVYSLWYKYTPSITGPVGIKLSTPSTLSLPALAGWFKAFTVTGSCPSLQPVQYGGCQYFNLPSTDSATLYTDTLTAGTTYYLMINSEQRDRSEFCIGLVTPPPPPPNDSCGNAIALSSLPVAGYTYFATQSMPADSCNNLLASADDDVWYTFTSPTGGNLTLTLTPQGRFDGVIQAYTGSCGNFTKIGCADAHSAGAQEILSLTGLTAGTIYYFRIYSRPIHGGEGAFTLTATGTALPITLGNFTGVKDGMVNVLQWTTTTEQDNKGFELQRSIDGSEFSTIAFMPTKAYDGNSNSMLRYNYTDAKPFAGNNYYRLKQIDKDGKATLSNVVLIKGDATGQLVLSALYPNPVKQTLNVVLNAPTAQQLQLLVTDIAGKKVQQQILQVQKGDNTKAVNVVALQKGTYIIKVICSTGCEASVGKFVKE